MRRTVSALAIFITTAAAPMVAQRFDMVVRADFFAGFRGDQARLARGMEACEQALARNPKDPGALVWHGNGLFFKSGEILRTGDWQAGLKMQQQALKEMDDAVALAPNDLQTLIPRGAGLLAGAPFFPDEATARPLVTKAVGDYEKALTLQAGRNIVGHSRGELLGGLAVGYRLLGDRDRTAQYLRRIVDEMPDTAYAERANDWLSNPNGMKRTDRFCIGCHE
jgi:tetratricopeptide (TPR) repeat protein